MSWLDQWEGRGGERGPIREEDECHVVPQPRRMLLISLNWRRVIPRRLGDSSANVPVSRVSRQVLSRFEASLKLIIRGFCSEPDY